MAPSKEAMEAARKENEAAYFVKRPDTPPTAAVEAARKLAEHVGGWCYDDCLLSENQGLAADHIAAALDAYAAERVAESNAWWEKQRDDRLDAALAKLEAAEERVKQIREAFLTSCALDCPCRLPITEQRTTGIQPDRKRQECCCGVHHPNYGRCLQCLQHGIPPGETR